MTTNTETIEWEPKLKSYPHFDALILPNKIKSLVQNPDLVSKHIFSPFLSYTQSIKKFSNKKAKERDIRYSSRKDSYIYSYYRSILLDRYEAILIEKGLNDTVIAYRKIKTFNSDRGKSNINFAHEAFEEIKRREGCIAIAFDIRGFFENLDHALIKKQWKKILGVESLGNDHQRIFRNITNYKIVDLDYCYKKLGLMQVINEKKVYKYSRKEQNKSPKLCSLKEYKEKVVKLIRGNPHLQKGEKRGIPQGSPISDMIANMCMLDFDKEIKDLSESIGGYYRRYSDDILLIIPLDNNLLTTVKEKVSLSISRQSEYLKIKESKTIITYFSYEKDELVYKTVNSKNELKNNAFEYLGFSFDGKRPLIKPKTITNYYKKMRKGIIAYVKEAYNKAVSSQAKDLTPYVNIQDLYHKYGNPNPNWKRDKSEETPSNFTTYTNRSSTIMGEPRIKLQIRNNKKNIRKIFEEQFTKYSARLNA